MLHDGTSLSCGAVLLRRQKGFARFLATFLSESLN
jgi:hypothetical protein